MEEDVKRYLLERARMSAERRRWRKEADWRFIQDEFRLKGILDHFEVKRVDRPEDLWVTVDITIDENAWVRYSTVDDLYTLEVRSADRSTVRHFDDWGAVCEEICRVRGLI